MSADTAIIGQMERLAMIRRTWGAAVTAGGGDFWTRADAAADETYENIVKQSDLTVMDSALTAGDVGNWAKITKWFQLHQAYLATPVASTPPGLGYSSDPWNTWCEALGIRAPWDFAELYYTNYGVRLDPQNVYPKGLWNANIGANATALLHKFGSKTRDGSDWTPAYVVADGALLYSYAPIIAVSTAGVTGSANITTVTACTNQAGATKTITKAAQSFAANAQAIVGEAAITTTSAAAQKVVTSSGVQAAGAFTADEWVLLVDLTNGVMELAQVDSIATNALTMKTNLLHTFTSTDQVFVWPLYTNVTACTVTAASSTTGQSIQHYARPDRAIAL